MVNNWTVKSLFNNVKRDCNFLSKNSINPRPGRGTPDLKDTGDFYRGIEARVTRQNLIMTGTDEKTEQLQFKYGEEIVGINMNKATFKEDFILPELREKVRQYLRA